MHADMPDDPATATARRRAALRLVPALLFGLGVFGVAHHLDRGAAADAGPAAASVPAPAAGQAAPEVTVTAAPKRVGYDPRVTAVDSQHALLATLAVPAAEQVAVPQATPASALTPSPAAQDEPTQPGSPSDGLDPVQGGPVDTTRLDPIVPGSIPLGPMHVDPMPPGVSLESPTDTTSLYARSGAVPLTPRQLDAASAVPPGTPVIRGLSQHVAPSCTGSGTDGKRVQAMYVHERSHVDRYASVLALLRNEIANVDDTFAVSAEKTGGDLRVRWVHDASCAPVVLDVAVPDGSLDDFGSTIEALQQQGFADPDRKYLAFADANVLCGIGTVYGYDGLVGNPNDGYAASYSRVDTGCWSTSESVAAHELTHNLGGVQRSAPHSTANGHCDDEADLMCYVDAPGVAMKQVCAADQEQLLDCHGDDYFNTDPAPGSYLATHWDTARSSFLDDVKGAPTGQPTTTDTPPVPPVPVRTSWSPVTHSKASPVRLSAVLRDTLTGAPLATQPVTLEARWRGSSSYVPVKGDVLTDGSGRAAVSVDPRRAGWFRFRYAGGTSYAASAARPTYVKVPTRLRLSPHGHLVVGRLTTVDGAAIPAARVTLQRRTSAAQQWRAVRTLLTDRHGVVRVRVAPARRASYRFVYTGEEQHHDALSARTMLGR